MHPVPAPQVGTNGPAGGVPGAHAIPCAPSGSGYKPSGCSGRRNAMTKLLDEIKYDLNFLKSHTLQPKWFKITKVFILIGFSAGYYFLFGLTATVLFLVTFISLMLVVHFTYRRKTNKFTTNWLDFIVIEEGGEQKKKRIGKYYYPAIIVNAIISFIVSQIST
jgi:hypothetical protein